MESFKTFLLVSFTFPLIIIVSFCSQVRASVWRERTRTNNGHQNTNQRKRECVLWYGSIFAKEKRVSTSFRTDHSLNITDRQWDLVLNLFMCFCVCVFRLYLNLVLGNVNVTLLSNQAKYVKYSAPRTAGKHTYRLWICVSIFHLHFLVHSHRFAYKDEYEKFKLYMTIILMFGAITCLFFLNCRWENFSPSNVTVFELLIYKKKLLTFLFFIFSTFVKSHWWNLQLFAGVVLLHIDHKGKHPHVQWLQVCTCWKFDYIISLWSFWRCASWIIFLCSSYTFQDQRLVGLSPLCVHLSVRCDAYLVSFSLWFHCHIWSSVQVKDCKGCGWVTHVCWTFSQAGGAHVSDVQKPVPCFLHISK